MALATAAVNMDVPPHTLRRCGNKDLLIEAFPELVAIKPVGTGLFQCELDLARATYRTTVRITANAPEGQYGFDWEESVAQRHSGSVRLHSVTPGSVSQLKVRIDYDPDHLPIDDQHVQDSLGRGLEQVRIFLRDRSTAPSPRPARDPLLHTGPRIPPDPLWGEGHTRRRREQIT